MRALKGCAAAAIAVIGLMLQPAVAATTFSYTNAGVALPGAACPPPPALPIGCDITALGTASVTSGEPYGPWSFTSVFQIGAALSATTFLTTGTFLFDDLAASDNDLFGTLTGVFDVTSFSTAMDYVITGGRGSFLGAGGMGAGVVFIAPQMNGPPTYTERGYLAVPEPGSAALLALGLGLVVAASRRRGVKSA